MYVEIFGKTTKRYAARPSSADLRSTSVVYCSDFTENYTSAAYFFDRQKENQNEKPPILMCEGGPGQALKPSD